SALRSRLEPVRPHPARDRRRPPGPGAPPTGLTVRLAFAHGAPIAHGEPSALPVLALLALTTVLYLLGVARERRRGRRWSGRRTAAFLTGMALVGLALLPPLASRADADLRGHTIQHLLLGMFAPIGLMLGAPLTLLLRALPVAAARAVVRVLHSLPIRALTHPATALVLNVGGMAVLYLTPLYAALGADPLLHAAVHFHFLAAGYVFAWSIA